MRRETARICVAAITLWLAPACAAAIQSNFVPVDPLNAPPRWYPDPYAATGGMDPLSPDRPETTTYGRDSLQEMERLFGLEPNDNDPEMERLGLKSLLALPLVRRTNGMEVLLRPPSAIAGAYTQRLAMRCLKHMAPIAKAPNELAVDTHVHTCYSHDSLADPADILRAAARRGLDAIAITDHDTVQGAAKTQAIAERMKARGRLPANFLVIPGEEITTLDGHLVALFITTAIQPGVSAAETVAAIHRQGGLAVAAHPELPDGLGALANTLPFDAVETGNAAEETAFAGASRAAAARRAAFYAGVSRPRLGSSDAHLAVAVGAGYTLLPDCAATPEAIRAAITGGRAEPEQAIPEDSARVIAHKRGPRLVYAVRSAFGSNPGGLSTKLQRATHADTARVSVFPGPGLTWSRRF